MAKSKKIFNPVSLLLIFALGTFIMMRGGCPQQQRDGRARIAEDVNIAEIEIEGWPLYVEIANTPELHRSGLRGRENLPPGHGMIYVFESSEKPTFMMKDTPVELSIAFINEDGLIEEIEETAGGDRREVKPENPIKFALALRRGFFEDHTVTAGTKISLPASISYDTSAETPAEEEG